jgi:hypothetical protein
MRGQEPRQMIQAMAQRLQKKILLELSSQCPGIQQGCCNCSTLKFGLKLERRVSWRTERFAGPHMC